MLFLANEKSVVINWESIIHIRILNETLLFTKRNMPLWSRCAFALLAFADIPSFILYLYLLILLIKNRQNPDFSSSFYLIFISQGIIDCLQIVQTFTLLRLPLMGAFSSFFSAYKLSLARIFMVSSHYFIFVQMLGHTLISLNRFTAITLPIRHTLVCVYYFDSYWVNFESFSIGAKKIRELRWSFNGHCRCHFSSIVRCKHRSTPNMIKVIYRTVGYRQIQPKTIW